MGERERHTRPQIATLCNVTSEERETGGRKQEGESLKEWGGGVKEEQ